MKKAIAYFSTIFSIVFIFCTLIFKNINVHTETNSVFETSVKWEMKNTTMEIFT